MKEALVVMAKAPLAGQVKTRLIGGTVAGLPAPLDAEGAAELYAALLSDTFATLEAVVDERDTVRLVLCYTPADALEAYETVEREGCLMMAQRGDGLGERLQNCFADLFELGYARVVVIGGDSPMIEAEQYLQAFAALNEENSVVCGPAEDGGYALLGMCKLQATLFEQIDWSTAAVFTQTRQRAQAAQVDWAELPTTYDIDTPADLARWQADIAQNKAFGHYTRRSVKAIAKRMRETLN